jgi:hypothetical protein
MQRTRRDARVPNFQQALNDQPLDRPAAEMQLFGESAPRIAFLVDAAAFPEHSKPVPHRTLCSVQYFRDDFRQLVAREVEQNPIVSFRPWLATALTASLEVPPRQTEFSCSPPDDMGSPSRMSFQKLAYCFLLS